MNSIQYKIEYEINTSISILYNRLSTPSGLSEWFADNVTIKNDILTFYWGESQEEAVLVKKKRNKYIRFRWNHHENEKYFEFQINTDEITKDILLTIIDFADDDEDREENIQLWNIQISNLKKAIGI